MFAGGAVTTRMKTLNARAAGQRGKRKPLTQAHKARIAASLRAYHKTCKSKPRKKKAK